MFTDILKEEAKEYIMKHIGQKLEKGYRFMPMKAGSAAERISEDTESLPKAAEWLYCKDTNIPINSYFRMYIAISYSESVPLFL